MAVLKMERPMDSWNDERLDELSRRMDDGFREMREGFARVDERFERVERRFDQRFERLYLVLITASIGVVVSNFLT
jgi:tRNA A-37 threonylcarbamoyl transferase component Bud32